MDGWLVGRDAATGKEVWRFQMGAPSQAGTISYEVNGEQYIATTNMAGSQPYSQGGNGQSVWAFKLGGTAKYYTGPRASPTMRVGQQRGPGPAADPELASSGRQHRGGHRPGQRDLDGALEQHRHLDG